MICTHELAAVALTATVALCATARAGTPGPRVSVVVPEGCGDLERFAAEELCGYLDKLFGIAECPVADAPAGADAVLIVGSRDTLPEGLVAQVPAGLSEQGIVLRRTEYNGVPALLISGGSPRATLWAVYELAHRWGVRSLLHGDVLPPKARFALPNLDVTLEPSLSVRQWRVVNDFAMGPESWGIADYRPVLDQLAKMKFNRIFVSLYTYQPFLDIEAGGIRRTRASLWYDFRYPITDDMPGRFLFGDETEFWNPDLPRGADYEAFAEAGQRHVRAIMDYARSRGMDVVVSATLTEFPPEFEPLLPGAEKVHQLAEMGIVPGKDTSIDDPGLETLAKAVLRSTVTTYPQADFIALGTPEFRQWTEHHEAAWDALDEKYGIERVISLPEVLARARQRTGYPGGADRALAEVQGDIVILYFYDRLLSDPATFAGTGREGVKVVLNSISEELLPILPLVLPPGSEILNFIDYTPSRIVKRRDVLSNMPVGDMPVSLIYTLHDDNVGVLPQLMTRPLHELTCDLRDNHWSGFSTRYWMIGDHDPCLAYLSRAAWDRSATPDEVYRDQIAAICGEAAVGDMLVAFSELEAATEVLEWEALGLAFPIPGMMMKHWQPGEAPEYLHRVRDGYARARDAAQRAMAAVPGERRDYARYWAGRLDFGVAYIDAILAIRSAATAEAEGDRARALALAENALASAVSGLEQFAAVARDRSDLGAIATMGEYVYRPLKDKVAQLRD
ncbi:MAG: hypothetical protein HPY44_18500 [Armatimonadetes bacterium]|nr:hypothetical protein [Armatimonadota bacterium]